MGVVDFLLLRGGRRGYLIVCVSINQELRYRSLIFGPAVFASTPVSKYSFMYAQSHSDTDHNYIGDFLVFIGSNN